MGGKLFTTTPLNGVGHGGGLDGNNSNLDIFVDAGYIVAVMSNYSNGASPLARKIQPLLVQMK
jgi:hypothetical protein